MSVVAGAKERAVLILHEDLSHGRHGASACVELHDGSVRTARVALRGWLDDVALRRLGWRFDDLARRGVARLLLDVSDVRHVDYRLVPELAGSLSRFEAQAGTVVVCGLSPYLKDIFRLAGCESRLRCWPSAAELLEPDRELAS